MDTPDPVVFPASALDQLLAAIWRRGFRLVGPVVKDSPRDATGYGRTEAPRGLPRISCAAHFLDLRLTADRRSLTAESLITDNGSPEKRR